MRPNIVLILIDDLGWKDLGCTGSDFYQTPHIDRVASEGTIFTQAYAASPICSPSRGAIYTGQYPARTKFTAVCQPHVEEGERLYEISKPVRGNVQNQEALHRHCLPLGTPTIGELLTAAGYRTGFVGKWHCGWNEANWPDKRGWSHAEGFRTVPSATRGHFGRDYIRFAPFGLDDLGESEYMTDVLTDRAVAYLEKAAAHDSPFFLTLSHYAVHTPLGAPDDIVAKYQSREVTDQRNPIYAAMIEKVDDSVGRIVETLLRLGIEQDTLLVFTSDNGGLSPDSTSNYPLMGGKSFCYEAGTRVPLIMSWPGTIASGRRETTPTISVDFAPTWLELAGAEAPSETPLDGESLVSLLTGRGRPSPRPIFFHHPHYTHAAGPFSSIIDEGWKLIRFYNDTAGREQLFDMTSDPYEQFDLCDARRGRTRELAAQLDRWLRATDAEMPRPNPAFDAKGVVAFDREFTWQLALDERTQHERNLRRSLSHE